MTNSERHPTKHMNSDRQGNMVIQNEKLEAVAVVVDGRVYNVRRVSGDKI